LERFKLGQFRVKAQIPTCSERLFDGQARSASLRKQPHTDYFFQSGSGFPVGYSPFNDGDRNFHNLSREFLTECAREQKCELFVLSLIVLASVWSVISMIVAVVHLIGARHAQF
jgi:hypothetical protein